MLTVTDGLSLDFISGALKVQLPPVIVAKAGWRFDIAALVEACGLLGLEKETRFRFTSAGSKNNKTGTATIAAHRIKIDLESDPAKFYHGITISQVLPIEKANEALWHELRHAWQAEAWSRSTIKSIDGFNAFYKDMDGQHGESYKENTLEIDARNYAANRVAEGKMLLR